MENPTPITSQPGIKRDGTRFDGPNYTDGRWCRWQRGRPRKMGGYRSVTSQLPEVVRGMDSYSTNGNQYVALGSESLLSQAVVNSSGVLGSLDDRTPAGFAVTPANLWQFDVFNSSESATATELVAHAAPNLLDISSAVETPIYSGPIAANTPVTATGFDPQSGGIVVLAPYLFTFGNGGRVDVGGPNDLTTPPDSAFITGQKIVTGLPLRGNGAGPSGIFWSLDSVLRATFNPNILTGIPFSFDTISGSSSILSSQGVIEYDGIYFWAGVDRFLMFNGVVREVPNDMNLNFFFDNINMTYRQKCFAFKVPRFGEIWWCFPFGAATECTHAVVYNVRDNTWYDTELPGAGRSSGLYAKVYAKPFMTDTSLGDTGINLWQHETGVDEVIGTEVNAIPSYFETSEITMLTSQQPASKALRIARIEPDFVQAGPMTVQVRGRANARAPEVIGIDNTFTDVAADATEQIVDVRELRRLMSFRFESNVAGGNYQMGKVIGHIEQADGRVTS